MPPEPRHDRPLNVTLGALTGDPRECLRRLAQLGALGIGGVQLSAAQPGMRPRDLDRGARRGVRERLAQLELRLSGIDLWIPPGHYGSAEHADRAADAIRDAIGLAADLGRIGVSLVLPSAAAVEPTRDVGAINAHAPLSSAAIVTAEALAAFVAGGDAPSASGGEDARAATLIASMLDEADRLGVDLLDHAAPPRADALSSSSRLRVGLDPAAWLARGGDPCMAAARHAARLGMVRLCDLTVGGLRAPISDELVAVGRAERQLEVSAFAGALSIVGRKVPMVIDARQWNDPWAGIMQSAEVWRRAAVA